MAIIVEQKIIIGLLEDDKQAQRAVAQTVSSLTVETDKMIQLSACLFTAVQDPTSPITADYIIDVTTWFRE